MNDGGPNGHSVITFSGNTYSIQFKPARRPADYQMNIYLADDITRAELDTTSLLVNVFAGSSRSKIEMSVNGQSSWTPLEYSPMRDPGVAAMQVYNPFLEAKVNGTVLDTVFGWEMDNPTLSRHIMEGEVTKKPSARHAPHYNKEHRYVWTNRDRKQDLPGKIGMLDEVVPKEASNRSIFIVN